MGQFYTEIPAFLIPWIQQQKMFWVSTAPLSESGHVNVSPKGFDNTFHIVNENQVWYEDMSGSGVESISHLRENGRITVLFCAFEGPPRIVRLFGTGTVHEFDTPEYNAYIPLNKRQPGSRSVIVIDVHKVGSSCGFSIPFYSFKSNRMRLHSMAAHKEMEDVKAESCTTMDSEPPRPKTGLKSYWANHNIESIDGLPGLQSAFESMTTFDQEISSRDWGKDDERPFTEIETKQQRPAATLVDRKVVIGFLLGVVVSGLWTNVVKGVALKSSFL
ncbi:hypothetical protein BDN70DRAFT_703892 [Pholiota conissans]|uniref:Pyridoxamine 5'-phosphate oxidase N-terminal domain-containing protein n=1 Tax=Pholiota conissans TaxID=109636 RepID=A0A9P5Z2Q6_9AGAR|nr:hypothetical protein BDN70DRAFT_703892 [Pholiota conissans]